MKHAKGIHHITAIAGDPQQNHDFYTQILGLRMIKKTVNFDDIGTYHFYFGDETGTPGSVLTFFPWPRIKQGRPSRGQAVAISFSVPTGSLPFWQDWLKKKNTKFVEPFERFGKKVLGLQDPDGLHLELVEDPNADAVEAWTGGPIPAEHAVRAFHGVTLAEEYLAPTGKVLEKVLGFEFSSKENDRYLYQSDARFGSVVEIIEHADLKGKSGKGTVHHVAFRARDEEEQYALMKKLDIQGIQTTEIIDRQYFRSIYFHEPGGVLFEIATDSPGFDIDESKEHLGKALKLPSWLESKRERIQQNLPDLKT